MDALVIRILGILFECLVALLTILDLSDYNFWQKFPVASQKVCEGVTSVVRRGAYYAPDAVLVLLRVQLSSVQFIFGNGKNGAQAFVSSCRRKRHALLELDYRRLAARACGLACCAVAEWLGQSHSHRLVHQVACKSKRLQ